MFVKATKGFTFIELIMAVVVLAILVAFAIPKYQDMRLQARLAQLDGMKTALSRGSDLIHYKAMIEKQTGISGSVQQGDVDIKLSNGYPIGHWQQSMRYIVDLDAIRYTANSTTICKVEWCGKGNQRQIKDRVKVEKPVIIGKVYPKGYSFNDACGVYYINRLEGDKPDIVIENDDC